MTFQVGDIVEVINPRSDHYGRHCTVIALGVPGATLSAGPFIGYEVDIPCSCPRFVNCVFRATSIRKVYDGNQKSSWDNCVWRPDLVSLGQSHE